MKGPSCVLVLVALVLATPHVAAHAEPWQSDPGSGERLAEPPQEVVVHFTERIYEEGSWIQVWDLSGNRVDLDDLRITFGEEPVMRISVPSLDDGPYLIRWQTYSQIDGHPIRGAIGFSVGGFAPPQGDLGGDDVPVGAAFARSLLFLGYVVAIGAMVFEWMVLRGRVDGLRRRLLDGFAMGGAGLHFGGVLWLMLDTALATGIGMVEYLSSRGGLDMWVRLVLATALLTLTALWRYGPVRPRASSGILLTVWAVALAFGARFGHAESAASWFVQTVHGAAVASWLGGMFMLLSTLIMERGRRASADEARTLGLRFSTLAIVSVTAMAVTGFALSLTILGVSFFDLRLWTDNAWRTFLALKISLVVLMLLLAVVNRQVFLARDEEVGPLRQALRRFADERLHWQPIQKKGGTSDFRKVVATEALFGVVVLVCAGFLMSVDAPANGLQSQAATYETTGVGEEFTALLQVTPEPAEGRFSDVRIFIQNMEEESLESNTCIGEGEVRDDCVRLQWRPSGGGDNSSQETVGIPEGGGWWLFERVLWTTSGPHDVRLDVSSRYTFSDEVAMQVDVLRATTGQADNGTEETA